MLARRGDTEAGCCGVIFVVLVLMVVVGGFISFVWSFFDDTANTPEPDPKPEKPKVQTATVHVTGDDGGAFEVSISRLATHSEVLEGVGEMKYTGNIESKPRTYPVDFSKFESDRDRSFEIKARKTRRWEGDLSVILEVNETPVECVTIRGTVPPEYSYDYEIDFDPDEPEDYEGDFGCKLYLWFY